MKIDKVASVADILLGIWLFFSMFFWHGAPDHVVNAGVIGALSIALGAMAYRGQTWARWIVGGLAVWLFLSVWVLPHGSALLVVNHLLVATLLFGFSVLPTGRGQALGEYAA
jgi:multisubunit Na+/H+ antiporter MnhB subunit